MFAVIPLCGNVVLLSVAVAVVGCAMGVIDTIANLQLVNLYHRDSAVFLQVRHDLCMRACVCVCNFEISPVRASSYPPLV